MPIDDTVQAVLVDAGGVLVVPNPERARVELAPFGACPDDASWLRAYHAGTREIDRLGTVDWSQIDRVVAVAAGVAEDLVEEALDVVNGLFASDDWIAVPGVTASLLALVASGRQLAVVSNASGRIESLLAARGICAVAPAEDSGMAAVAVVVDSHVVGVEKPDPAIFGHALAALGVGPEHCVHVGDSALCDVAGALEAGIRPIHVDPYGWCPDSGHEHVTGLGTLVAGLSLPKPV